MKHILALIYCISAILGQLLSQSVDFDAKDKFDQSIYLLVPKNCSNCKDHEDIFKTLEAHLADYAAFHYAILDSFPLDKRIALPTFVFKKNNKLALYSDLVNQESIQSAFSMMGNVKLHNLTDDNFESLTQASTGGTTGNWLVLFAMAETSKLENMIYEGLALRLTHAHTNMAILPDSKAIELTKRRFSISTKTHAQLIFISHGGLYRYPTAELNPLDINGMYDFVVNANKLSKKYNIPAEISSTTIFLDNLEENVGRISRRLWANKMFRAVFLALVAAFGLFIFMVTLCRKSTEETKNIKATKKKKKSS